MKILIAEDITVLRMTLFRMLSNKGYDIVGQAINGEEAVSKYKELKPDVLITDLGMPKKSGIEAIREIMSIDESAKIIVCSALDQKPQVIEALKLGVKGYIVKPFKIEDIIEVLEKLK